MASSDAIGFSPPMFVAVLLIWGLFSTWTDTLNKIVLNEFTYPVTATLFQFGISSLCGYILLPLLGVFPYQNGHKLIGMRKFLPAALCQTCGFLLTNVSYGRVAISFTQTVKASAPLFSLFTSTVIMGVPFPPASVYLALIPIVGGVVLTAATELTFDSVGFLAAAGSNVCFTTRSIVSKPHIKPEGPLDSFNIYHYMSTCAFILVLPVWLVTEAPVFISDPAIVTDSLAIFPHLILCSVFHFTYNQVSIFVLSKVAPLTHSVCNVMRRVVVIVVSIIYFKRTPPMQNIVGIVTVFAGVIWYLSAKARTAKAPAKKSA